MHSTFITSFKDTTPKLEIDSVKVSTDIKEAFTAKAK
jgi:hypothetical protein